MARTAVEIADAAAARGREKRERMRQEYPGAAAATDACREAGLEVAAVMDCASGKWFGTRTKDAVPPALIYASEVEAALKDGRVRIAGQIRERRGLLRKRAETEEGTGDV